MRNGNESHFHNKWHVSYVFNMIITQLLYKISWIQFTALRTVKNRIEISIILHPLKKHVYHIWIN